MGVGFALHNSEKPDSKDVESLQRLNQFIALIGGKDDHSMVLSLATFIEDTLGRLLIAYFRNCKATRDLVKGFNAPLGTFGSRIKAVYSFGLVTEDQYRDMDILRKVRNKFAHNWEGVSLDDGDIKGMVGQLSGYTLSQDPIEGSCREKLLGTLSSCCIELQVFLKRIEAGKAEKATDVSHRLSTEKYTGPAVRRFVD